MPSSSRSRASSVRIRSWVSTSSPVVGSSSTATGGSQTQAMAIVTRCCWPPESWCGYRSPKRASVPSSTRDSAACTDSSEAVAVR